MDFFEVAGGMINSVSSVPVTLFCFPCAGASATMYFRWRRLLPELKVIPVELPGRGERFLEPLIEDFDTLVSKLCEELSHDLPKDYAIFGHSMGGMVGYGLIRAFQKKGLHSPHSLWVSACAAPTQRDYKSYVNKRDRASLLDDLHRQGGTPPEVFENAEFLEMVLQVLSADYRVCESYHYEKEAPLSCPIHVFAGKNDRIERESLEAWSLETLAEFSLQWFEGGHFFIRSHEAVLLNFLRTLRAENNA